MGGAASCFVSYNEGYLRGRSQPQSAAPTSASTPEPEPATVAAADPKATACHPRWIVRQPCNATGNIEQQFASTSAPPATASTDAVDMKAATNCHPQRTVRQPNYHVTGHIEWLLLVFGFGFTALGTAAQCLQTLQPTHQAGLPITYYLFCFALILTLNTLVLSVYIACGFHFHNKLEPLGLLFVMVAFILAVTLPFSLWFKLTTWACFASSLTILVSVWYFRGGSTDFRFSRELPTNGY